MCDEIFSKQSTGPLSSTLTEAAGAATSDAQIQSWQQQPAQQSGYAQYAAAASAGMTAEQQAVLYQQQGMASTSPGQAGPAAVDPSKQNAGTAGQTTQATSPWAAQQANNCAAVKAAQSVALGAQAAGQTQHAAGQTQQTAAQSPWSAATTQQTWPSAWGAAAAQQATAWHTAQPTATVQSDYQNQAKEAMAAEQYLTGAESDSMHTKDAAAANAASSFQACLELLKGPTDEKRLVGLLLAIRSMQMPGFVGSGNPAARQEAIRTVAATVGHHLIDRLLLPVTKPTSQTSEAVDEEKQSTQMMLVGTALAIMGVFCQVPDLAAEDAMLDRLPAVIQVAAAGGVRPIVLGLISQDAMGAAQDEANVQDALECALLVAKSGSKGTSAVLEAGGLRTAVLLSPTQPLAHLSLAVRLVATLVAGEGVDHRHVLQEWDSFLPQVVTGLCGVLGDPRLLQQPDLRIGPATDKQPVGQLAVDVAELQLEVLHTLLLLLPLPEDSEAAQKLQRQDSPADWTESTQRGLNWLLRSKTGGTQRLSAMQLAAAMVELRGPRWILNPSNPGAGQLPDSFLQVLAETLWVELSLLLHDALHPQHMTHMRAPRDPDLPTIQEQLAGCDLESAPAAQDLTEQDPRAAQDPTAQGPTAHDPTVVDWPSQEPPRPQRVRPSDLERVAAAELQGLAEQLQEAGGVQQAGERAEHFLPACYRLVEAVVEVLCKGEEEALGVRDEVAEQVMKALGRMVEDLQQFVAACQERRGAHQDPLLLGAIRVLGAYYAQAPEAASTQLQELLPFMMQVSSPFTDPLLSGPAFLQPLLLMTATQLQPPERQLDWRCFLLEHHKDILYHISRHATNMAQSATRLATELGTQLGARLGSQGGFPLGAQAGAEAMSQAAPLAQLESSLWDACELLFAVVDAGASAKSGGGTTHSTGKGTTSGGASTKQGGDNPRTGGADKGSKVSRLRGDDASVAGASVAGVGPITQMMLPLVWQLAAWAEARLPAALTSSMHGAFGASMYKPTAPMQELRAQRAQIQDPGAPMQEPWTIIQQLCAAGVSSHVCMSAAGLVAVVLEAVVRGRRSLFSQRLRGGTGMLGERVDALVFEGVAEAAMGAACRLVLLAVRAGAVALWALYQEEQGKPTTEAVLSWSHIFLEEQLEIWERTAGAAVSMLEGSPAFAEMCMGQLPLLQELLAAEHSQSLDMDLVNLRLFVSTLLAITNGPA